MAKEKIKKDRTGKLKVFSLGGLGEIGKNITVLEYENDIIVIDAGMGFPDEDMLGINEVMRFKWKEGVLYKLSKEKEITADEKEGLRRYSHLAEVIAD